MTERLPDPWQQPGRPLARVASTDSAIHPYELLVGDHTAIRVPLTAAALRALRDSLTALLDHTAPATPGDFVAEWAEAHGAVPTAGTPVPEVCGTAA